MFRSVVTSRRWVSMVTTAAILVALAGGAFAVWQIHRVAEARAQAELERAVSAYLAAWGRSDWKGMRQLVADPPRNFAAPYRQMTEALKISKATTSLGAVRMDGSTGLATFEVRLSLTGLGDWRYSGRLSLTRREAGWRVRWSPSAVVPGLRPGLAFARTRKWPPRAPILARNGDRLTIVGDVVTVGLQPGRIEDIREVQDALRSNAGVDPKDVTALLNTPGLKPNWFLPVITLRRSRYEQVKPDLYPIPGIVFRAGRARILLEEGFAQHVVGRVHEATEEDLRELGAPYQAGDVVGAYGLERAFEGRLAGRPSGSIELVDSKKKVVRTLFRFPGQDPEPVRTTLDIRVQRAAEAALAGVSRPAALVAVEATTGDIRAVASRPLDGAERALSGRYPPGSTFKIVTASALVAHGMGLEDRTTCPPEVNAGGKVFTNFEGEAFGSLTFAQAFAESCNTAFIQMAATLPGRALGDMARTFGFGAKYSLPVPVAGGQFPAPKDDAERAAAAIGQGRVLASPVHMATVGAAVAGGAWRAARLVATDPKRPGTKLPGGVGDRLSDLMGLVVTEGTASGAGLPGEAHGKTGTAEFGNRGRTHAWFVGFRGRLGFAVLVEGGGVGGRVAAPIAGNFLGGL